MPQTRSSRKRDLSTPATGVEVKMGRTGTNPKLPSVDDSETRKPFQQSNDSVATTHPTASNLNTVLVDRVQTLSKCVEQRSAYVLRQQKAITEARERKESNQARIVEIINDAVDMIKLKETKLMAEVDVMTEKQLLQLNDELLKEEADLHIFQLQSEFTNKSIQDGDGTKFQTFLEDLTDIGDGASQGDVVRPIYTITFNHDSENVGKAVDDLTLAQVDFTYHDNPLYIPVLVDTINCTNEKATDRIDATDVTVLDVNESQVVVVTDGRNHQLISFYTGHQGPCYSVLKMDHFPYGIARLTENRVITALPKIAQLVTVEVAPEMTLLSKITCSARYYSVAVLSPTSLVAGGGQNASGYCVDIIDMEGNVLKSITSSLIHCPAYLFVNNSGNILVSDGKADSVFCMTPDGDVVWKHDPSRSTPSVRWPNGIIQTNNGDILVSGANGGCMKVMLLTGTGEFVRDVLTPDDGPQRPSGLCLDKRGYLFVCDGNDIKKFTFTAQKQ